MAKDKRSRWTIASARQNLPTLVDLAVREPQEIYRRDTLVARVVGPGTGEDSPPKGPTAIDLLAELQRVCGEEDYELPVAPRVNRPNAFAEPGRTKRTTSRSGRTPRR